LDHTQHQLAWPILGRAALGCYFVRTSLVFLQLVSPVGGIGAPLLRTTERLCARVGFYVAPQLARLHKCFATLVTLEVLLPVVRPEVCFEQSELCRPVLASLKSAPVNISLMDAAMGSQVGVVLGAETADCAFELPLVSVDRLVLLQGVLVAKGLAAYEAGEARLAVDLLVLPQRCHRISPEITTL